MSGKIPDARWLLVVVALFLGLLGGGYLANPATGVAQQKAPPSEPNPHYTVVFTDGTNLGVTDNSKEKLYFYTIDLGEEPGADLKLRAYVDLKDVGKKVIHPTIVQRKTPAKKQGK